MTPSNEEELQKTNPVADVQLAVSVDIRAVATGRLSSAKEQVSENTLRIRDVHLSVSVCITADVPGINTLAGIPDTITI